MFGALAGAGIVAGVAGSMISRSGAKARARAFNRATKRRMEFIQQQNQQEALLGQYLTGQARDAAGQRDEQVQGLLGTMQQSQQQFQQQEAAGREAIDQGAAGILGQYGAPVQQTNQVGAGQLLGDKLGQQNQAFTDPQLALAAAQMGQAGNASFLGGAQADFELDDAQTQALLQAGLSAADIDRAKRGLGNQHNIMAYQKALQKAGNVGASRIALGGALTQIGGSMLGGGMQGLFSGGAQTPPPSSDGYVPYIPTTPGVTR